ncbi:MAG: putative polysaccharide biosynthesis protein [Candidatus Saccharibacteria bacterium]
MPGKNNFLWGAFILGMAGIISKIIGAVYRIPLGRYLGGEGIGLYQMAYPFYTIILALATAGIPVAISIMIAQRETAGLSGDSRRIFRVSFVCLFFVGVLLSLLVYVIARPAAVYVMKQPKAALAIMAIAPAVFLASIESVFRGYFQGYQRMVPTAISQVVEQLFRAAFVVLLALWLLPRGLEVAAAGATFGAVIGGAAGVAVLVGIYIWDKLQYRPAYGLARSSQSSLSLASELLHLAVPVSLGAVVMPLVQLLDTIIVPMRLASLNLPIERATELFGQLTGMASILVNLPMILTVSIGTSLVPAAAEAMARHDRYSLYQGINNGLRVGLILVLPAAVGLAVLAEPIMSLLFDAPEAGIPLAYLSWAVIALAVFQITGSSLQGIGLSKIPMRNLMITGVLKVIMNYTLTGITLLNIKGPAISTVIAFSIGALLNMVELARHSGVRYEWGRFAKLAVFSAFMGLAVKWCYTGLIGWNITSNIATTISIILGMLVYGFLLAISKELDASALNYLRG